MTDLEYDLLDELYFVISFDALQKALNWEKLSIQEQLKNLLEKQWVKCIEPTTMIDVAVDVVIQDHHSYLYLATKKGLLAHHSKD